MTVRYGPRVSTVTCNTLPDDPNVLKQLLLERDKVVKQLEAERDAIAADRDRYKARLMAMLQRTFGKRAETLDENQLQLFAEEIRRIREEIGDDSSEHLPDETPAKKRVKQQPKRAPLPADLPRVTIEHDLPENEKPCPCCGEARVVIARDSSEQLEIKPVEFYVVRHERLVYACPSCRNQVQRADKPHQPIERSIAGPSVLAHLVTSKWEDHLPLHRIEKMMQRAGIVLSRSTQVGLMHKTAELVMPLVDLMWMRTRGSPVIHTDDTTMPTQVKGQGRTQTGRLWPYIGRHGVPWDLDGSYVVVEYTGSRAVDHVTRHLAGWSGHLLQADCFAGYRALDVTGTVTHAACLAHARRKFHDARTTDINRSTRALAFISSLYEVERAMQDEGLSVEEVHSRRSRESRPILEAFMTWIETELASTAVLPKSPMGHAMAYVLNHRAAFMAYLDDGRLAIDNNLAERTIRPIALGRKNFLFAGSARGGRTMATLMSLVSSARLHKLNVHAYVTDVITRIAGLPSSELPDLLPDRWKAIQAANAAG